MTLYCVCVPARNEAARLPVLLDALAGQTVDGIVPVALCINNSDDGSADIARAAAVRHSGRIDLRIEERRFPGDLAHAGSARRQAMDTGLAAIEGQGVLISTDADCRPPAGWISAMLAAVAGGADLVGGRIILDESEPIDPAIMALQQRFDHYWTAVRAIEDAIDPSPCDPPPRHGDHTGASLAIDAALYAQIDGVPLLRTGEDRALVTAAVAAGGRLAHPQSVWTRVSARSDGRADGGMAAVMAERARGLAIGSELLVPGFEQWRRRAAWRRGMRGRGVAAMLAKEECLPSMVADMPLPVVAS